MMIPRIEDRAPPAARASLSRRPMPPLKTLAILGLSLIFVALALSAAVVGRGRESLYAEPGRLEATRR